MHFTVRPQDKDLAIAIQEAMDNQTPVKITFRDVVNRWPCTQGSPDIVTKVEKLGVALNSPFGGKAAAVDEDAAAHSAIPQVIIPGQAGKKVLICTEAESAAPAATAASAVAPAPAAQVRKLPEALELRR